MSEKTFEQKKLQAQHRARIWKEDPFDQETQREVARLEKEDPALFVESFYKSLEFGTGGLRALMGIGTNRVNIYTVLQISMGLITYAEKKWKEKKSVVVGYDGRHHSKEFAQATALLFADHGIDAFIFSSPRPTPFLSFLVRELKTHLGIMITASHNPKEYNGYKVYGPDGGQVSSPIDAEMMQEINLVTKFPTVDLALFSEKVKVLSEEFDQKYFDAMKKAMQPYSQAAMQSAASDDRVSVVYTPLHGVGGTLIEGAMKMENVDLFWVEKQRAIDPDFPTVAMPNPEDDASLSLALEKANEKQADLLIATDADSDRVRIGVFKDGRCQLLTGNQMAVLLADYCLSLLKENNRLPSSGYMVKTIVTTAMVASLAKHYGVELLETLPGFKYIGGLIEHHKGDFLLGLEDSCGYLVGEYARDKDGIEVALFACCMALHCKKKGKTLIDRLEELYLQFGFFEEKIISLVKKDPQSILDMMAALRKSPVYFVEGMKLTSLWDVQKGVRHYFDDQMKLTREEEVAFDKSNVLIFSFEEEAKKTSKRGVTIFARPSGTEPKIKFYVQLRTKQDDLEKAALRDFIEKERQFLKRVENKFLEHLPQT